MEANEWQEKNKSVIIFLEIQYRKRYMNIITYLISSYVSIAPERCLAHGVCSVNGD